MKKILVGLLLGSMGSVGILAQDSGGPRAILNSQRVSSEVSACVNNLDESCILSIGLNTVMDEALSVERIRVLAALTQALAETGDVPRAQQPLDIAMAELEGIKFGFIKRMKQLELAPVLSFIGSVDQAIALLSDIRGIDREKSIERSIMMAAKTGNVEGVIMLKNALTVYKNRSNLFLLDAADVMLSAGHQQSAKSLADRMLADTVFKKDAATLYRMAALYRDMGDSVLASQLFDDAEALNTPNFGIYTNFQNRVERLIYALDAGDPVLLADAQEMFSFSENDFSRGPDKRDMAQFFARLYIKQGRFDEAVALTSLFETAESQANYLIKLSTLRGSENTPAYTKAVEDILIDTMEVESALERDDIRLKLLESVRAMGDFSLSQRIVLAIEDDDSAAKGLALLLPFVSV